MSEVKASQETTSGVEETSEEVRWRMEKVVQHACATRMDLEGSAKDFRKALAELGGQGDE